MKITKNANQTRSETPPTHPNKSRPPKNTLNTDCWNKPTVLKLTRLTRNRPNNGQVIHKPHPNVTPSSIILLSDAAFQNRSPNEMLPYALFRFDWNSIWNIYSQIYKFGRFLIGLTAILISKTCR